MAASKSKKAEVEQVEGTEPKAKGERKSAVVGAIDFGGIEEAELANVPNRRSPWDDVLDQVYDATQRGDIGRDSEGNLKFVKIGEYAQSQSAKAQVKSFKSRNLDSTYEFKVVGKQLLVRCIETPDED